MSEARKCSWLQRKFLVAVLTALTTSISSITLAAGMDPDVVGPWVQLVTLLGGQFLAVGIALGWIWVEGSVDQSRAIGGFYTSQAAKSAKKAAPVLLLAVLFLGCTDASVYVAHGHIQSELKGLQGDIACLGSKAIAQRRAYVMEKLDAALASLLQQAYDHKALTPVIATKAMRDYNCKVGSLEGNLDVDAHAIGLIVAKTKLIGALLTKMETYSKAKDDLLSTSSNAALELARTKGYLDDTTADQLASLLKSGILSK